MKKLKNVLVTLLSVLMMLTLFVGCSDNSAEDSDALGYVSFSEESVSRGLETENLTLYGVEDLYWTYTAEKIRGNYTTGQSAKVAKSAYTDPTGKIKDTTNPQWEDGIVAGSCTDGGTTLLYLTSVKSGPAKGLKNVEVGPFSVGQWRFKLYGYKTYNAESGAFEGLVYKGTTGETWSTTAVADDIVSIDAAPTPSGGGTKPVKTLVFNLSGGVGGNGVLYFKPIKMTVPEGQEFHGPQYGGLTTTVEPRVRVLVFDMSTVAGTPQLIAVSTTKLDFSGFADATTAVFKAGEPVKTKIGTTTNNDKLDTFNFITDSATDSGYKKKGSGTSLLDVNEFAAGVKQLAFVTFYQESYEAGNNSWDETARYVYDTYTEDIPAGLTAAIAALEGKILTEKGGIASGTGTAGEDLLIDGFAPVGNIAAYNVGFTSGVKTILGGDLNDLLGAGGKKEDVKFDTAVAKITWTSADDNPCAVVANTDVYDPETKGKAYTLFTSFEQAVHAYNTYSGKVSTAKPYIELLANIEPKGTYTPVFKGVEHDGTTDGGDIAVDIPVLTGSVENGKYNGFFFNGLTIPASTAKNLVLIPEYDSATGKNTKGSYTFTASDKNTVIKNFSFELDNETATSATSATAWIYTDVATAGETGLTLTVDTTDSTLPVSVNHSGVANVVNINFLTFTPATGSAPAVGGYFLGTRTDSTAPDAAATSIGTLNVTKGRVEIGGRTTVNRLVSSGAADGAVVLNARADALIQSYSYNATELMHYTAATTGASATPAKSEVVVNASALSDAVANGGFTQVILTDGATPATSKYIYGIEGYPVTLPSFGGSGTDTPAYECRFATTAPAKFMNWNDTITSELPTGNTYADCGSYVPKASSTTAADIETLTAVIAKPVGGRIFDISALLTDAGYRFYGASDDGSVKELTEWKSATTVTVADQIKKLESAVYMLKKSTATETISVVWTDTDPASGVTAKTFVYKTLGVPAQLTKAEADGTGGVIETLNGDTTFATNRGVTTWAIGTKEVYETLKASGVAESVEKGNMFDIHSFWTSTPDTTVATKFYVWVGGTTRDFVFVDTDAAITPAPKYELVPVATI